MNLENELISKLTEEINRKSEEVIAKRLADIGVEFNLEKEQKRRFKSLIREVKGDEETIYYNDGSIEGLRLITFVTKVNFEDGKVGFTTTYY